MRHSSTNNASLDFDASPRAALGQLQSVLPVDDWSLPADDERAFFADFGGASLSEMARALCRERKRHVVLTGDRGVGKTTLVRRLAAEASRGEFPRLAERQFVRIDVSNVGPEDSRACLELILSSLTDANDLVVCLDGLASLCGNFSPAAVLVQPLSTNHQPLLWTGIGSPCSGHSSNGFAAFLRISPHRVAASIADAPSVSRFPPARSCRTVGRCA